jgi:hypothetical protein
MGLKLRWRRGVVEKQRSTAMFLCVFLKAHTRLSCWILLWKDKEESVTWPCVQLINQNRQFSHSYRLQEHGLSTTWYGMVPGTRKNRKWKKKKKMNEDDNDIFKS